VADQLCVKQLVNYWLIIPSPLVLRYRSITICYTVDRNQTTSRRFKPNSRPALIDEQSNPLQVVLHKDARSRHRGAIARVDKNSTFAAACYP